MSNLTLDMILRIKREIENPPPTLDGLEREILLLDPIERAADQIEQFVKRACDSLSVKYGTWKTAYMIEHGGQKSLIVPPGFITPAGFGLDNRIAGIPVYTSNFI